MNDPRLNSIHLEPARRQMFRSARDVLLHARGDRTMAGEKHDVDPSKTHIDALDDPKAEGLAFWLMDQGIVYPLKVGLNTVGRSPDNDVVVPDAHVSRRH